MASAVTARERQMAYRTAAFIDSSLVIYPYILIKTVIVVSGRSKDVKRCKIRGRIHWGKGAVWWRACGRISIPAGKKRQSHQGFT
jgi:hypothetical protein